VLTVRIDTTAPTLTATNQPPANDAGWNHEAVTTSFTCTDELSGIATCTTPLLTTAEGTTSAIGIATDLAGNEAATSSLVRIDRGAPACIAASSPQTLWPPNHRMAAVAVSVTTADPVSGVATWRLVSVASDEPDEGLGDGDKPNDIQGWSLGAMDTAGSLRAERSGLGDGRVYALTYAVEDAAGNMSTCGAAVAVPHDEP
jgi:hypothetical protein